MSAPDEQKTCSVERSETELGRAELFQRTKKGRSLASLTGHSAHGFLRSPFASWSFERAKLSRDRQKSLRLFWTSRSFAPLSDENLRFSNHLPVVGHASFPVRIEVLLSVEPRAARSRYNHLPPTATAPHSTAPQQPRASPTDSLHSLRSFRSSTGRALLCQARARVARADLARRFAVGTHCRSRRPRARATTVIPARITMPPTTVAGVGTSPSNTSASSALPTGSPSSEALTTLDSR